jgi:hypothetical protein
MSENSKVSTALLAGLLLVIGLAPAATQPSSTQINAIRQSCRSDFMSNCSGVQPGGKDAIECLERNVGRLSPACKAAVNAVTPKPATPAASAPAAPSAPPAAAAARPEPVPAAPAAPAAQAVSQQEQIRAIQESCTLSDFTAHCSWIKPDSPEVLLCLQANVAQLSPNCQTAVRGLPAGRAPAAAAIAPAPPPAPAPRPASAPPTRVPQPAARPLPRAPAPAPAAAHQPTPEQLNAIRSACRSDFMSHCAGVQPGGAEAMQCLQRNVAQLSPSCKSAVAAINGGAPAASQPAAATATAAPAGPAPFVPRRLRLIEELAILRSCGADQRTFCAGVPPGGGRVVECLAKNAPSLSPQCAGALASARP